MAELGPLKHKIPVRRPGLLKGRVTVSDDFDAPLPPDMMAAFEGESNKRGRECSVENLFHQVDQRALQWDMSLTSKSPEQVAREALAVAATALPRYSHTFSPKLDTQPQLFACLVLKTFFTTDYRGIAQVLADLPELVRTLGLETVPHFTTLHKAARRLLRLPWVHRLLTVTIRRVRPRRRRVALAALDSTGFECRHISAYSVHRRSRERSLWQTTT